MNPFNDFHPRSREFKLENAWACAHAAELAYPRKVMDYKDGGETEEREETEEEWRSRITCTYERWGFKEIQFWDVAGTQCYLVGREDLMVLSFRGTQVSSLEDLATDIRCRLRGGPLAGKVHRGFLSAFDNVWDDRFGFKGVEHEIKDMKKRLSNGTSPALWITGHSLGAALATLACAAMAEVGRVVMGLHTFGSPRVGDHEFARALDSAMAGRNYRLVNNSDIVTRLVPRKLGYEHAGHFWYLTEAGVLEDDPNRWWVFLDVALGWICDLGKSGFDSIKDHTMENAETGDGYIPALRKNLAA